MAQIDEPLDFQAFINHISAYSEYIKALSLCFIIIPPAYAVSKMFLNGTLHLF